MVKLNDKMKEDFSKIKIFPFATASKAGVPNVVPIGFCKLMDDDTIWIADNYFDKTLKNLQENPKASIFIWSTDTNGCYQIKGDIEIKSSGDDYNKMYKMVKEMGDKYPAKHLVVMKITNVYECKSGSDAGKKLL